MLNLKKGKIQFKDKTTKLAQIFIYLHYRTQLILKKVQAICLNL